MTPEIGSSGWWSNASGQYSSVGCPALCKIAGSRLKIDFAKAVALEEKGRRLAIVASKGVASCVDNRLEEGYKLGRVGVALQWLKAEWNNRPSGIGGSILATGDREKTGAQGQD